MLDDNLSVLNRKLAADEKVVQDRTSETDKLRAKNS